MGRRKRREGEEATRLSRILAQAQEHAARRWQLEFPWSGPPAETPAPPAPARTGDVSQLDFPWNRGNAA